jgi:hypothetical protein
MLAVVIELPLFVLLFSWQYAFCSVGIHKHHVTTNINIICFYVQDSKYATPLVVVLDLVWVHC